MNPELHGLKTKRPVLDHGFVRLVDCMGDDARIVEAARVSYGDGAKTPSDDRKLIRYMMRHQHWSPFEQVVMTFHCKLPIFVARQWSRHRTGRTNELSGRYSVMADEAYMPERGRIMEQSVVNRQGSGSVMDEEDARDVIRTLGAGQDRAFGDYRDLIDANVARELARINLPLSTYTEWFWQIDLRNMFNFLKLRLDGHAQYEIRVYAEAMAEMVRRVAPLAYEAFEDYILGARTFSAQEMRILGEAMGDNARFIEDVRTMLSLEGEDRMSQREKLEMLDKLGYKVES